MTLNAYGYVHNPVSKPLPTYAGQRVCWIHGTNWVHNCGGCGMARARVGVQEVPAVQKQVYLAGSLRNPSIVSIHKALETTGWKVFSDWFAAGHEADDWWKSYYTLRGFTYKEALKEPASVNVFEFDKRNIDASDVMVLALPAGKSGHLELGYHLGKGKPGYILLDDPERWDIMYAFATGLTDDIEELCEWIKALPA